jgi:hypothetical protein
LFVISESGFCSDFDEFVENLISHCSSHFNELNWSLIEAMTARESLKLRNEDSLYLFIKDRVEDNCEISKLLEYVRYEYLSAKLISDFVSSITQRFEIL